MREVTLEQWADVATLGLLAVMWWTMLALELRRTWRWDALGKALTALTAALGITYSLAVVGVLVPDIWIPAVRYALRIALFASGAAVIAALVWDGGVSGWDRRERGRR